MISKKSHEWAGELLLAYETQLIGRFASPKPIEDAAILRYFCHKCPNGNYLEIGVLWGGSLIIAGLSMEGEIWGIDPLEGWYGNGTFDPYVETDVPPSEAVVRRNLHEFGVKATLFLHEHPPYPQEIEDLPIDVAFIDGNHSSQAALIDWDAVKDRTRRYVIFHDLHQKGPPEAFGKASADPNWKTVWNGLDKDYSRMGVLERISS